MIKGRCPICRKGYEAQALADLPTFPFCSERCRLIDLGRWAGGNYAIPGPEAPTPPSQGVEPGDEGDD